jgi:DNA-binding MarR family transcriptional regulator
MEELPLVLPRPRGLFGPLLELIARRVRAEVESELANFNLRPRHVIALTVLDVLGEPSQSALAESLRIDRTNLVGLLNELEAAHLIERRRSGEDRRRHIVALTAVGARRLDEIQDGLAEAEGRVFASLDSEQQATLYALLEQAAADAVALPAELSAASALTSGRTPADPGARAGTTAPGAVGRSAAGEDFAT